MGIAEVLGEEPGSSFMLNFHPESLPALDPRAHVPEEPELAGMPVLRGFRAANELVMAWERVCARR